MAKKKEEVAKQEAVGDVGQEDVGTSVSGGLRRVKVTQEELMKLQTEGKLIGYDPATQEAIIK